MRTDLADLWPLGFMHRCSFEKHCNNVQVKAPSGHVAYFMFSVTCLMMISIYCSSHFNSTRWFTAAGFHFRINDVDGTWSGSELGQFKIHFHKQTSQAATCQIQTFTLKLTRFLFFGFFWWYIRLVFCLYLHRNSRTTTVPFWPKNLIWFCLVEQKQHSECTEVI